MSSREHREQDDAQLEKQAKDIVEGKKRAKRRGHELGSDESGSEDEDADRRRRKSIKKPRFDGGKLEGIGSSAVILPLLLHFPLIRYSRRRPYCLPEAVQQQSRR